MSTHDHDSDTEKEEGLCDFLRTTRISSQQSEGASTSSGSKSFTNDKKHSKIARAPARKLESSSKILKNKKKQIEYGKAGTGPTISRESWKARVEKIFDEWDPENPPNEDVLKLLRLVQFISLTMFQCLVKNEEQMTKVFTSSEFQRNVYSLVGYREAIPPPHPMMIKQFIELLETDKTLARKGFTLIIGEWIKANRAHTEQGERYKEFLEEAILKHTRYHGMGLIKLVFIACEYFKQEWDVIRRWTAFNQTKQSWQRVSDFMEKYENPENPSYTHPWARLIDDKYFLNLSCNRNVFLCGILAVVAARVQGHQGIWKSAWVEKNKASLEFPKRLGATLLEMHGPGKAKK